MQDVQVVFQGGGAKLSTLLAAAAAIQSLHNEKVVRISRVSGASAGAIAAALLATGVPIEHFRTRLRDRGTEYLRLIKADRSSLGKAWSLICGHSILSENGLRAVLWDLLEYNEKRFESLKLPIPLMVVASDIRNGRRILYDQDAPLSLIDALVDSAAIPFVFRGASAGKNIVDGGLCENLPILDLASDEESHGIVVAVSFARTALPVTPASSLGMLRSLLSTAISNSVNRATEALPDGRVILMQCDLDMLDFDRALKQGLVSPAWGFHFERVQIWLRNVVNNHDQSKKSSISQAYIAPVPTPQSSIDVMERLAAVYSAQHHNVAVDILFLSLRVTAYCLLDTTDSRATRQDWVEQKTIFDLMDKPLFCYRFGLTTGGLGGVEGLATWRVTDKDNLEIDSIPVPITVPRDWSGSGAPNANCVLLFFNTPLRPEDRRGPYTIIQQDQNQHAMLPLRDHGADILRLTAGRGDAEVVELVIEVPKSYTDMQMIPDNREHQGRAMSKPELAAYGPSEAGFDLKGWRGGPIKRGESFGVALKASVNRVGS